MPGMPFKSENSFSRDISHGTCPIHLYTVKYRIAAASELEPLPIYSRTNQVIPKEKFNNGRSRLTAATTLVKVGTKKKKVLQNSYSFMFKAEVLDQLQSGRLLAILKK